MTGYLGFIGGVEAAVGNKAPAPSYKKTIQPIFNANCVYCHMSGAMQGGLTLEPGLSPRSLVSIKSTGSPLMLVVPGKPNDSYLIHKLEGTHLKVGGMGASMPFSAGVLLKLEEKDLALIHRWILLGAVDN
ncbi:MAG: hypothetical protein EPO47_03190 [Rugosibacter sp.]|nr:MAG: hypothetical protein EPO60_04175 [Rugosibacter sp.]TBR10770.1 MAG: hypothetical protein EPO47_03190 [Rugosibacter sp.]